MHKCLKCKKEFDNLDDIADGCSCGSKVFVFSNGKKDVEKSSPIDEQSHVVPKGSARIENPQELTNNGSNIKQKIYPPLSTPLEEGDEENVDIKATVASAIISDEEEEQQKVDEDYQEVWLSKGGKITQMDKGDVQDAGFEIENVHQTKKGIYELDINGIKENPLVVKDSDGVYHIRLPFANIFFENKGSKNKD